MKIRKLLKRAAAVSMAAITAFTIIPTTAFATGDVGKVSFTSTYDSNGKEIKFNSSATFNGYTEGGKGENKYRPYVDGETAYCIQPGVRLRTGDTLKKNSSKTWNALSEKKKIAVGLALLYGYQGNRNKLKGSDDEKWLATQAIAWEFITGCRETTGSYQRTSKKVFNIHFGSNYANNGTKAVYNQIASMLKEHNTIPSFMSTSKTGVTKQLSYENGKYSITLTDSNGALADYSLSCANKNISIIKSGNKVTISSTSAIDSSARITAKRNNVPKASDSAKLIAYGDPDLQDVVTGVEKADAVTAYINVETPTGSFSLKKTSEDGVVSDIAFTIKGDNYEKNAKTSEDGTISVKDMSPGTYTITEANFDRYVPQKSQTFTVVGGKTTTVNFSNILKKFNVTVSKSDVETGTSQGDASLAGAVYGIYKGNELIDTYTTDLNGQFTTKYYICGDDWTVREISPSEGYLLDETSHHIGAEAKNYTVEYNSTSNSVTEQVIKGNIAIIKHTDDGSTQIETPEEGATFEVYLKSAGNYKDAKPTERDLLTCDKNGFAQTKDMPYGIYTVHQTAGWEGRELMKDFDVFINADGETYRYLINNANFRSFIKIVKKDAETNRTIPYAGAGFQIYDPDGKLVKMTFTYPEVTTIDTFYTTADGQLITPETLDYGKGYSLVEVQAPYGYVLNSEPVYFDVIQDNSEEESGITLIEVVRSNKAQKGKITINKSGEIFSSVSENEGIYQPIYSVQGLEGATYEITAAEDIYTLDGTLRASKGDVVDTITTSKNGIAKTHELYLGKYEVKEIKAPDGMVLNGKIHSVELIYAGQEVSVTEVDTSFYNERQRVQIELKKSLEIDESYGVGVDKEILDVTFGLYAEKELTANDGTTIPADALIEVLTVDENGFSVARTDLPFGNYYIRELTTNSAYLISDKKYPVIFEYGGQETAIIKITVNDGEAIENDLIYGSINGKKINEDGKNLEGATIGIFKPETIDFIKDNAIETTISAEDGSFSFDKVPYGTWIIRELECPTGYVLSEESIIVTIGAANEVIEIELVNNFIKGNITLTKVDKDYPDNKLSEAVFEVYTDTNINGEYDKDDKLIGEMGEFEKGIYQINDLRYGQYFVREKSAPKGFILDKNIYPVSIEEHEKTYIVENKAGVGFINTAQKGSLKIVKTSTDNKINGFSFRIVGENGYDKTFMTKKDGEIVVDNLRVGKYIVSEINDKASAGYILPDEKQITIKADITTTLTMHNELRDTPKTGDDFQLGLWIFLAAASVLGAFIIGFVGYKSRIKKED